MAQVSPFDMVAKLTQLREQQGGIASADQYAPAPPKVDALKAAYAGAGAVGGGAGVGRFVGGGDNVDKILATIRQLESSGNYGAKNPSSTASGAYQFLDTSWGGYGGYRRAADAPQQVQDQKAREWVQDILRRNGGDVGSVPVTWYIGHVPNGNEWDRVPGGGNTTTPRQYQQKWLGIYNGY